MEQEWLLRVLNAVGDLEVIPSVISRVSLCQFTKAGVRILYECPQQQSYRGVTLTSVAGKLR